MEQKTEENFRKLGMSNSDIKRINGWMEKLGEERIIEIFKEKYEMKKKEGLKDTDLVVSARKHTYYEIAQELQTKSQPMEFITLSSSGATLTKHGREHLSEDEIKNLSPGEVPENLKNLKGDKNMPKPIWSKSYDVVIKDKSGDFKMQGRLLQYNENVKKEVPLNCKVKCNVNVRETQTGLNLNWAKDTESSVEVLEKDIDTEKYIMPSYGIVVADTKFTNKDLRIIRVLLNEGEDFKNPKFTGVATIWQNEGALDVEVPPALTPMKFLGFGTGKSFNNVMKFESLDGSFNVNEIGDAIPVFEFAEDLNEWFNELPDTDKQKLEIGNNAYEVAGSISGKYTTPIYCVINASVLNMNLKPHEKTGNGWILLGIEGEDINNIIGSIRPDVVIQQDIKVNDEVYAVIQPRKNLETGDISANSIDGIKKVSSSPVEYEKPKEIKETPKKEKSKPKKEEKEEKEEKKEKKEEPSDEEEDMFADWDND